MAMNFMLREPIEKQFQFEELYGQRNDGTPIQLSPEMYKGRLFTEKFKYNLKTGKRSFLIITLPFTAIN